MRLREKRVEAINNFQRERLIGEITVYLPKPPAVHDIAGWDKEPSKQRFEYTIQPAKNKEPSQEFLDQEFDRFENGYWFFNNGNLEWITPFHYFFLNYWKDKGKTMKFIDSQRDAALWIWQIERLENMAGGNLITNRRFGKTVFATAWAYFRTSTTADHRTGIQSKTNPDSKLVFNKLVKSWQKLPDWLKPIDSGETRPATVLEFSEPRTRSHKKEKKIYEDVLDSSIDYRSSAADGYDGDELHTYLEDEFGKCHTKGTQVLMFDGTYKNVEDVVVGDKLMGDDSTKRIVKSLARGKGQCYNVKPVASGWYEWGCNDEHLLSLIWSYKDRQSKFEFGKVYNMSVKDFLKLTKTEQKHFCLYKKQVSYPKRDVVTDPYFLGLWLGDGSSWCTSITTDDDVIVDYLQKFCDDSGLLLRTKQRQTCFLSCGQVGGNNYLLKSLQHYKLIKNKHIPEDYILNDDETRLAFLAGFIDSDGHKPLNKDFYEITQKRKCLADGLYKIITELGFKCNVVEKIATMKRKDGSIYSGLVYRLTIFGLDLHRIPCKVERKIIHPRENLHLNTRNSLKTCFKLEDIGEQDYYGFTLDKNHLYLLKDCTVTHNCVEVNTDERWGVVQFCLMIGSEIVGKALRTTTVEEMEKKGGKHAKKTWDDSTIKTLDPATGRTTSMLTNLFISADYGFKGRHPVTKEPFVDDYGYSNRELAKSYILSLWTNLEGDKLAAAQRKNPLNIKHAFQLQNFDSVFDNELLELQKDYLENEAPKSLIRRVTFGKEDNIVKWRDDPRGHFEMVWDFADPSQSNKREMQHDLWKPKNTENFAAGVDPFAATITTGPGSMGVCYIYRKGDPADPENSGFCILRYAQRTKFKADFHRNVMMLCQYYGCKANYESDVDDYYEKFLDEGFKHYIMWRPKSTVDPQRKNVKTKYGTPSKDPFALQKHTQVIDEYIKTRYDKIYFLELVNQLIEYDIDNRTKFDDVIAFGMALIGGVDGIGREQPKKSALKILKTYKRSA